MHCMLRTVGPVLVFMVDGPVVLGTPHAFLLIFVESDLIEVLFSFQNMLAGWTSAFLCLVAFGDGFGLPCRCTCANVSILYTPSLSLYK